MKLTLKLLTALRLAPLASSRLILHKPQPIVPL